MYTHRVHVLMPTFFTKTFLHSEPCLMLLRRPRLWFDRMIWTRGFHPLLLQPVLRVLSDMSWKRKRDRESHKHRSVMTGSTFGSEPEDGVQLDVDGSAPAHWSAEEEAAVRWSDLFQRLDSWDVAQLNRVAGGACGCVFRKSHPLLVHLPAEDAGREQQAIPVSGYVAGN